MNKLPILIPQNYDEIFALYKKYIDPHIQYYKVGCSCSNSISEIYNELIRWIDSGKITDLEK